MRKKTSPAGCRIIGRMTIALSQMIPRNADADHVEQDRTGIGRGSAVIGKEMRQRAGRGVQAPSGVPILVLECAANEGEAEETRPVAAPIACPSEIPR